MSKHCTLLTNTARFFSDLPLGGTGLTKPNAHCTAHWVNIPSPKGGTLQRLLFSSCGISSRFLLLFISTSQPCWGRTTTYAEQTTGLVPGWQSCTKMLLNFFGKARFWPFFRNVTISPILSQEYLLSKLIAVYWNFTCRTRQLPRTILNMLIYFKTKFAMVDFSFCQCWSIK